VVLVDTRGRELVTAEDYCRGARAPLVIGLNGFHGHSRTLQRVREGLAGPPADAEHPVGESVNPRVDQGPRW